MTSTTPSGSRTTRARPGRTAQRDRHPLRRQPPPQVPECVVDLAHDEPGLRDPRLVGAFAEVGRQGVGQLALVVDEERNAAPAAAPPARPRAWSVRRRRPGVPGSRRPRRPRDPWRGGRPPPGRVAGCPWRRPAPARQSGAARRRRVAGPSARRRRSSRSFGRQGMESARRRWTTVSASSRPRRVSTTRPRETAAGPSTRPSAMSPATLPRPGPCRSATGRPSTSLLPRSTRSS